MSEASELPRRRQRHPRSPVRLPVRISTIDAETDPLTGEPFFLSTDEECQNLSRGGLFVVTRERVPQGSRLLIEISIPGEPAVQAIGRVAWSRVPYAAPSDESRPGIGVEFLGGSRADLAAVERYVDRLARRSRRTTGPPARIRRPATA